MVSNAANAKAPHTTRGRRRAGPLTLLAAVMFVSAVEPLRPRRVRRRVASHRDLGGAETAPDLSLPDLTSRDVPTRDLEAGRGGAELAPVAELAEHRRKIAEKAADADERTDPFAGHGYGDVPGLRWSDDLDAAVESDPDVPEFLSHHPAAGSIERLLDDDGGISRLVDWHTPEAEAPRRRVDPATFRAAVARAGTSTGPLHPDQFPPRLRVERARDDVDVLAAQIQRFVVADIDDREIECVIRPTLGWAPDDFGGNRRHDFYWGDAEQLVLRVWDELTKRVWIDGSRLEAWLRIDGVGVFVPIALDGTCTVWKFMNEFRTAIELSHR